MISRDWAAVLRIAAEIQVNSMVTEEGLWEAFEDALDEEDIPHDRFLKLVDMLEFVKNAPNN